MKSDRKKVLIAGCGYLGSHLASELIARGHGVSAIRRRASLLPEGVRAIELDLFESFQLEDSYDWIFYTAAASTMDEAGYSLAYIEGLKNTIAAMADQPERFIFVSSTSVYGDVKGEWVDEDSDLQPSGYAGAIMMGAERLVGEAQIPASCLRLGGIYGPGRDGLVQRVRENLAQRASRDDIFVNRIHIQDAVGMLVHLAELDEFELIYNGVDSDPAARNEVLRWLAEHVEVDYAKLPLTSSESVRGNKRCRNRRILESGYALAYPSFREGYLELLGAGVS